MAKIKQNSTKKAGRPVGRPPRAQTTAQKVEELKLGKFAECEPMCLPEKEIKRSWQIIGAIVLMLGAIAGLCIILLTDPVAVLTWDNDGFVGGRIGSLENYWLVMELMLAVATLVCIITSVMLFAKKRVPALLWYILIVAVTVGLLCASFHTFKWFEARKCYENYPGIYPEDPNKGSGCPSVENDLIMISLRNLAIYTVGIVTFYSVWRMTKNRSTSKRRR